MIRDGMRRNNHPVSFEGYVNIYKNLNICKNIEATSRTTSFKEISHGWKDESTINRIGCPSKGPGFNFQDPRGSSKL